MHTHYSKYHIEIHLPNPIFMDLLTTIEQPQLLQTILAEILSCKPSKTNDLLGQLIIRLVFMFRILAQHVHLAIFRIMAFKDIVTTIVSDIFGLHFLVFQVLVSEGTEIVPFQIYYISNLVHFRRIF